MFNLGIDRMFWWEDHPIDHHKPGPLSLWLYNFVTKNDTYPIWIKKLDQGNRCIIIRSSISFYNLCLNKITRQTFTLIKIV